MNKKFFSLLIIVLTGLLFVTVGVLTAADVPDEIVINNEGYKKGKKGPVKLTHKKHSTDYKVACAECHHVIKDGKNVWKEGDPVQKCSECHSPLKTEAKKAGVMKLQNAYHKNCKNCHKELAKAGKSDKAPYKKCNDCHEKRAK